MFIRREDVPLNPDNIGTYPDVWQKMVDNFFAIHNAHVQMVQVNMLVFYNHFKDRNLNRQLDVRFDKHDVSKTEHPEEFAPYVWRYWRTTWKRGVVDHERFNDAFASQKVDYFITSGVWHHVKYNRHHPEYHLDHDDMTQVDLIEMVSDWYAMSEEYNSNIDDWVTYVVPRRYHFSADKVDTINQLIEILRQYKLKDQKGG